MRPNFRLDSVNVGIVSSDLCRIARLGESNYTSSRCDTYDDSDGNQGCNAPASKSRQIDYK